jgi:hypothetical protein
MVLHPVKQVDLVQEKKEEPLAEEAKVDQRQGEEVLDQ